MGLDYRLRTHKHIERNIILAALKDYIGSGEDEYQYVGFGAEYFKDFIMIHEQLNINNMVSIERNSNDRKRYEFNRPYNCIKILFGEAKDKLASLTFKEKMIIWLDFTDIFSENILEELFLILNNIKLKTIVLFTFNIERPLSEEDYIRAFDRYKPLDYTKKYNAPLNYAGLVRKTMDNLMGSVLDSKYGKEFWATFFDFTYKDNAKMQTIGIVLDQPKEIESFKLTSNSSFLFNSYNLAIETLTPLELIYLKHLMPKGQDELIPWCNTKDKSDRLIKQFKDVYKYYPLFGETIS